MPTITFASFLSTCHVKQGKSHVCVPRRVSTFYLFDATRISTWCLLVGLTRPRDRKYIHTYTWFLSVAAAAAAAAAIATMMGDSSALETLTAGQGAGFPIRLRMMDDYITDSLGTCQVCVFLV